MSCDRPCERGGGMAARGARAAAALAMGMKSNSMAIAFKPTGLLQIRTQSGPNQSACPPTEVTKQGKCPGRISFNRGKAGYLRVTGGALENGTRTRGNPPHRSRLALRQSPSGRFCLPERQPRAGAAARLTWVCTLAGPAAPDTLPAGVVRADLRACVRDPPRILPISVRPLQERHSP